MNESNRRITAVLSAGRHLHNTGGPRSRVRTEKLSLSIFDVKQMKSHHEVHELNVPPNITNIEEWVLTLCEPKAFVGWDDLAAQLNIPDERMLVIPFVSPHHTQNYTKMDMLRSAVILSKCNKNHYLPDSPMIFTRSRLHRRVELIKLNLNQYYELD